MKFNSAICTSRSQSERLLALGLKAETADMAYNKLKEMAHALPYTEVVLAIERSGSSIWSQVYSPAWSLHRLIEMLNYQVIHNGKKYEPVIAIDGMAYQDVCSNDPIVGWSGDLYTDVIDCIKWLICIEQFNKEYLEE